MNDNITPGYITLLDILIKGSDKLDFSLDSIEAGHNGPYKDEETRARNIAHWIIIFSCIYKETKEIKYKEFSYQAIDLLLSEQFRPMKAAFFCRKNPLKDFSNGVMGQAWIMEALIYSSKVYNDGELMKQAISLYRMHSFDSNRSLWRVLNVEGSFGDFDQTFNHQLWFASIAAKLDFSIAKEQSLSFMDNVLSNVELYSDGIIYHKSSIYNFKIEKNLGFGSILDYFFNKMYSFKIKRSLYSKSVGYHSFNLVALSYLYSEFKEHAFFKSKKFEKIISVIKSEQYLKSLKKSKYSYQYNPPGIEEAIALSNIISDENYAIKALERHFSITGISNTVNVHDYHTSLARLYEIALLDIKLTTPIKVSSEMVSK